MITVRFFTSSDGALLGYDIKGHAGYGEKGGDIVCAAVSSAALMTANTITEIIRAQAAAEADDDGEMFVKVARKDAQSCRDILGGFKLHMLNLEEQYSDYIQVSYMEV